MLAQSVALLPVASAPASPLAVRRPAETSPLDTLIDDVKAPAFAESCRLFGRCIGPTARTIQVLAGCLHLSTSAAHLCHGRVMTQSPCAGQSAAARPSAHSDLLQLHVDPANQHAGKLHQTQGRPVRGAVPGASSPTGMSLQGWQHRKSCTASLTDNRPTELGSAPAMAAWLLRRPAAFSFSFWASAAAVENCAAASSSSTDALSASSARCCRHWLSSWSERGQTFCSCSVRPCRRAARTASSATVGVLTHYKVALTTSDEHGGCMLGERFKKLGDCSSSTRGSLHLGRELLGGHLHQGVGLDVAGQHAAAELRVVGIAQVEQQRTRLGLVLRVRAACNSIPFRAVLSSWTNGI
jgi:hypothetical protein